MRACSADPIFRWPERRPLADSAFQRQLQQLFREPRPQGGTLDHAVGASTRRVPSIEEVVGPLVADKFAAAPARRPLSQTAAIAGEDAEGGAIVLDRAVRQRPTPQ